MNQQKETIIANIAAIPSDYQLASETNETRNRQPVSIWRYQTNGHFVLNGPRLIAIFAKDTLISLKNFTYVTKGRLPEPAEARSIAENLFAALDQTYSRGLAFLRIEQQERSFFDQKGILQSIPVLWIKFGHTNGSYNWVTLGADGMIVEVERDSRWDFFGGRRKTEMWDNDDWVLARYGNGPQLPSPNALA